MAGSGALDGRGVLVSCRQCGTRNRLVYSALGKVSRCGKCQAALEAPAAPLEVPDAATFQAAVASSSLPVVVDFWAPWCAPCRMMAPELDRIAAAQAGRWLVIKANTEAVPELGQEFRIRSIPTLALFLAGREVARDSGARPAAAIQAFVDQHLTAA